MITRSISPFVILQNSKLFSLLFIIIFGISLSLTVSKTCTEQWTEIKLNQTLWNQIGDVEIKSENDDLIFEFDGTEASSTSSNDIGGAVWHPYDFSKKKGLLISFKPQITYDPSYYGSLKYPHGFAIVFTSSSIENLIGEKGSGIGYEKIMNAVAFEFDFVRNTAKGDSKYPHFSLHFNVSGPISSKEQGFSVDIPNFYDSSLDGFYKNIIFEIQLIGNKVILRSNRKAQPLLNTTFTAFQQLLEQEDVHVGITASMNLHKKVSISYFKISEVSKKDKGYLSLKDSNTINKAGEEITLLYSMESICGEKLKIYSNEYNSPNFSLIINGKSVKPNSINFNENSNEVELKITEDEENIYTAVVDFQGQISSPSKFSISPSDVQRFELCDLKENNSNNYNITSELEQTKDFFYIPICSYDQFGNTKSIQYSTFDIKIKYPNNLVADALSDKEYDSLNKRMIIKVPISTFGLYELFNEDFIQHKKRYYNFMPQYISPEKSELSILYGNNIFQKTTKDSESISLKIKVRDNYGRDIPIITLKELNCDFSDSKVYKNGKIKDDIKIEIDEREKEDYVLLRVTNPGEKGKYKFVPKVKCSNIDLTELYCGYDSITKLNNCEFYYRSDKKNEEIIKAYSDYLDSYITYHQGDQNQTPLILSLDENENKKLTEIIILDEQESIYFKNSSINIEAKLNNENLICRQIGNKYALILPESKNRQDFSSTQQYIITLKIDSTYNYNIPIQFYFLDQFMNNVNNDNEGFTLKYIAFYKQNSHKLKASETLLLFDIYELYTSDKNQYLGNGKNLEKNKVKLIIDSKETNNNNIVKYTSFISVINHDLTKAGKHSLKLIYNEKEIALINIEIESKNEAYFLGDEEGVKLANGKITINSEELKKFTLLDKFENLLKDNNVFNAFARIKISDFNTFMINPNYDGKIHIFNNGKTNSKVVTMKFENGTEYVIVSSYSPTFQHVDPSNSYGEFDENFQTIISYTTYFKINLFLQDKFGNEITSTLSDENRDKINIYIDGKNIKEIIPLSIKSKEITNNKGYEFTGNLGVFGDFEVKIFINDFPVQCKACHFRNNNKTQIKEDNSIIYLLGNKRNIPIVNHCKDKTSIKAGLVNKNNNFIFYYKQRDEFLNEIKGSKSISLTFTSEDKNVNIGDVSINNYGRDEDEKGFFKVSGNIKELPNGLYKITKSESSIFYVYLTDSEFDDSKETPNSKNSMILLNNNKIYGKTDIPGSFILDLRTDNYKRIKNLNKQSIKINNINSEYGELNARVKEGPEEGLLTIFLLAEKPGKYEFTVSYENIEVINQNYVYICGCGFDKKLRLKKNEVLNNGNYIFFNLVDSNQNECYNLYNLNDINLKEYGNFLLSANGDAGITYKTETYYNHMTNTFVVYFNRHVSGTISFSSDLIRIEENQVVLTNKILDQNHFYVNIEDTSLKIKILDDNYEPTTNTEIKKQDFDMALIRIVNDDFVTLKNDFDINDDFTVNISEDNNLMDADGKYLYIVYYKGKEIFCQNCMLEKSDINVIDMTKTKIYHKEGNNNYIEYIKSNCIEDNMIHLLSKNNFPFFVINLMSGNNNLIIVKDGIKVTLSDGITSKLKYSTNGNIYVYLESENERKRYLELPTMAKLNLKVEHSKGTYEVNYYVMNDYVEEPNSIENCPYGAIPNIATSQTTFIKRVNQELEIEIYLSGCGSEQKNITKELTIIEEGDNNPIEVENLIPTDIYGGYLLFLPNSLSLTDSKNYYIQNKKSKSKMFELTVLPGYDVKSIVLKEDETMTESTTDKLYTYFYAQLKDENGNIISNIGRNLFANDLFIINAFNFNDLPYRLTYDINKESFRCQVPINGAGILEIKSKIDDSSLQLYINDFKFYSNSLVNLELENENRFTLKIKLKDDFYKELKVDRYEVFKYDTSFKYLTYNPINNEIFIKEVDSKYEKDNKFIVTIPTSYPKYSVYGIIPLIKSTAQICPSCLKKNEFPDYIYSISDENYIPHNIVKPQYLIKGYDKPIYLYLSHIDISLNSLIGVEKEQINGENINTKFYIFSYKDSNNIKIEFSHNSITKKFEANYKNYELTTIGLNEIPQYSKIYGFNSYNINHLDNKTINFFIEIRDNEGRLISTEPKLYVDNNQSEIIKKITPFKTCYIGIYFVKISFSKSGNFEYYLKFNIDQIKTDDNCIQIGVIPAFPNQIILTNKERISARMISYELAATNYNAEQICDDRLNLYIDEQNLKSIQTELRYIRGACSLYVQFYGDAIIKSNIENFNSEINNNDVTLYNLNPQFSSISILPNIFKSANVTLTVSFNEKSPSLTSYNEDEIIENKYLFSYQYFTPTKFRLITNISNLYSTIYSFSPDKFKFRKGNTYISVGTILDNIISPTFINYQIDKVSNLDNINVIYFSKDKKINSLTNIMKSPSIGNNNGVSLDIPFILKVNFLDSNGVLLDISKNLDNLNASIILILSNELTKNFDLIIRQFDDNYFFVSFYTNLISEIKHLPTNFQDKSFGYFIKITYLDKEFYSSLILKPNVYHAPNIDKQYNFPLNKNNIDSFTLCTEIGSKNIYTLLYIENIHHICLITQEDVIPNIHLDPYKVQIKVTKKVEVEECYDVNNFVNSYMGCIAFSEGFTQILNIKNNYQLELKYNDKENNIPLKIFKSNTMSFSFNYSKSTKDYTESSNSIDLYLAQGNDQDFESNEYFEVYINGDIVNKKDISVNKDDTQLKLSIPTKYFNIRIPNYRKIMIIYTDEIDNRTNITNDESFTVEIEARTYDFSQNKNYKFQMQDPLDLKVGDNLYFYLLIKDTSYSECYYGDLKALDDIEIIAEKDSQRLSIEEQISRQNLIGISKCEYIYKVELNQFIKKPGDISINIKDYEYYINSKLHVSVGEIDENLSYFSSSKTTMTAGETLLIDFIGLDSNENKVNGYDLKNNFDIKLVGNNISKENGDYSYIINVASDNNKLNIKLTINKYGNYEVKALYNHKEMELKQDFQISVGYGNCSLNEPDPKVLPIDKRNSFYPGEIITIEIECKDNFGNKVSKKGSEIFTANIKKIENDESYSYTITFYNGKHLITFTPPIIGNYTIDISLNGKKYGQTIGIPIVSINKTKYNCMDKRQVDRIQDCDSSDYRELLKEILGESLVCLNNTDGKLFKCSSDSECILHTNECNCLDGYKSWNGYCYPIDSYPPSQIIDKKITCIGKLKSQSFDVGDENICDDGTCRLNKSECNNTKFECPIGYKVCGVKCILLSQSCSENIEPVTCSNDEVLCWDLTCAEGYDLCPTRISCPNNKVLCPDGSCQLSGHCIQPVNRTCEKYQCPDFSCVSSKSDCLKNKVCEVGLSLCDNGACLESCEEVGIQTIKYRCSNGKYVENVQLCPTEMFTPSKYIKCPNGGIALNTKLCRYVQGGISINCPNSKPILCPDFACVEKGKDCSIYIPSCPSHKPYQCWNNECRASLEDCPTPITCPDETPILCQSGLCVKTINDCKEKKETICSKYRCFDGTCVSSMELCPTHTYCGKDAIKCWNGACVKNIEDCRSSILSECSGILNYRCPDGTCRKSKNDCSTLSVCPSHLPIKCYDNSCRASIKECPNYEGCGDQKVSCPDGTCALSYELCNTVVTCIDSQPFLCYDNSCKTQLSDCPEPPKCSKNEVLCPNGECLSSRQNCKIFDPCDEAYPTRCEMNTCVDDYNQCNIEKTKRCPIGYILCTNGECKTSEYLCNNFQCPKNKPYFCSEGVCVEDKELCDKTNGCPYNRPKKCPDGNCVKEEIDCSSLDCGDLKQCPDGSCIDENKYECPLINGCYKDRPFKCADGTCINPETSSCSIVLCPINAPYKCPNGYCVSKSSDCPSTLNKNDINDCGDGLIMCIDGRCVKSTDYCRPSFECEAGYTLCKDGTCRISGCPQHITCPEGRISCGNNICAKEENECNSGMICPSGYYKCPNDGSCKNDQKDCEASPKTGVNGCLNGGVKCPNGRCMTTLSECSLISDACPDDSNPFLCSNGECVKNLDECYGIPKENNVCEEGKSRCLLGKCVNNDNITNFRTECTNYIGCPLDKPYRCSNGLCVESERKCEVTTTISSNQISSNIACDESKPYLCSDVSCVSDPSFCKSYVSCDNETCPNGYCLDDKYKSCIDFTGFCPISSPIHCPSGTCVDDITKCSTSFHIPKCSEGEFYCARLSKCLRHKLDCFLYYEDAIKKKEKTNSRILLENFANPLIESDFINIHKRSNKDILTLIEEDNSEQKFNNNSIEGTFCYDGTLVKGTEKCPIVPACKMGHYRCQNGGCASDLKYCLDDEEYECLDDEKKCPDGMCHKNCSEVLFNGCETGKYQCTNGLCVDDKYDCIGHSMCQSLLTPFRCINGECKSSPEECEMIERLGTVKNLTYSFNKYNKIKFNFAFNTNGRAIGSIEIPGNGFDSANNYSRLYIREVPSSILYRPELYNNSAEFLFNISNSIVGSEGILNFENSIMSPIFKFYYNTANGTLNFKLNGLINIAHNQYEASGLYYYDYCLAKLAGYDLETDTLSEGEDAKWECIERQSFDEQTQFQLNDFGVYAVILNPSREKINYFADSKAKNFFLENVKIILIVLACIIVIVAIVFYIFLRVTRYRQKYHENRSKILLLQQQKQEYENMTTDIFGQTLGDNINGIVYKSNPAYTVTEEIKKSSSSLEDEIEKLQIECKNVNEQNERLQKDIADITDQYKVLSASIENMNK